MAALKTFIAFAACVGPLVSAATYTEPATSYSGCQKITSNPLENCPHGTIYVSQEDYGADFRSIQAAIRSLPNDTSSHVILIGAGIYHEKLNVTRAGPVTLLGQSNRPADGKLYADVGYGGNPHNEVQVYHNAANHDSSFPDNVDTGVLTVGPTYNATETGAGPTGYPVPAGTPFGCKDFRAYNIDFRNNFAPESDGPAHALGVGYANTGFYSCGFYSYQDTVFIGKLGNAIMYDCIIAGETDFLYGFGTFFIERSAMLLRNCGGGLTAWKGTNTTFDNKYGVYISNSKVMATNTTVLKEEAGVCSLGRPWNSGHRSVIMNTYLDKTILDAGYTIWSGEPQGNFGVNTTMAVFKTYGPGNDHKAQVESNVTEVFNKKQVRPYMRPVDVFMTPKGKQPNVGWVDPIAMRQSES